MDDIQALISALAKKQAEQGNPDYNALNSNGMNNQESSFKPLPSSLPLPNGGMTGEVLDKYIQENPGPSPKLETSRAPTRPLEQVRSPVLPSVPVAPAPAPIVQMPSSVQFPMPSDPYGADLNDSALQAAQADAKQQRMLGGLGNAASMLGSALSRGAAPAVAIGKDTIDNADSGVKNILQRREGKDKDSNREKVLLELNDEKKASDPNSNLSKSLRDGLKTVIPGLKIPDGTSALQLRNMGFNMGTLVSAKIAADGRREAAAERNALASSKAEEKKEEKSKLSDKQVESINEFDDSISKTKNVLDLLGNNSSWTGPIDGNVPDMLSGNEQVAFRSAVGRMQDSYRKLITGAGASNKEIARLESRIPSPSDTFANFQAKAKEFISEVEKAKSVHLGNFKNQGKNTKNFQSSDSVGSPKSSEDPRVDAFMKANNIKDRNEAIKILKDAGHL